ncbi:MAG: FtsK/SpoIIIE domain-containing protein [Oscillospiraceae bacterium]|nr:FtsK/SpoIIIE domain-containing protein [Oscillospiraceae bacterium]
MKNNEIMITVRFRHSSEKIQDLSFLVLKDISLRSFIEALYYGLAKQEELRECSNLFIKYIKTRKELIVLYSVDGENRIIDFSKKVDYNGVSMPVYELPIDKLGFVTSSCIYITTETSVSVPVIFNRKESASYILKDKDNLEYNISTRRLNVIESSVIDIIPPSDMPSNDKSSLLDVLIPTVMSTGGMLGSRVLIMKLSPASSGMGNTMLLMSAAMGVVALVTSMYNFFKKRKDHRYDVNEWKNNYENYIERVIKTIKSWQDSDIVYLNTTYPEMSELFKNTADIDGSIFSRSQNDSDFMKISLGTSDEVKPLFEIKFEKKDNIIYDTYYQMKPEGNGIEIILPSKKMKRKLKKMTPDERAEYDKNKFLLTELAYNFANKGEHDGNTIGFNYLRSSGDSKPPLLLDLKNCGALGVITDDDTLSHRFIRHVVYELSYYHSPEDLQFVFLFNEEKDVHVQDRIIENYKCLPHTNELFDGVSQFVFDKESSGTVFGQLLSIMNERAQSSSENEENEEKAQKFTQIVCIVFYDYDIKESGFSKFLPEVPVEGEPYVNSLGLTFIFIQAYKEMLPKYCGNIVNIDANNKKDRKVSLRYNVLDRETLNMLSDDKHNNSMAHNTDALIEYKSFQNKYIFEHENSYNKEFGLAYRQLSSIYYKRIAENGNVPSMVTLFELYGYNSEKVEKGIIGAELLANWSDTEKNDVTRNLCVPIGKNEHGPMNLDLYEKADGPHMLVAGTTGSGKSETIITYLIGLCMKFSPMDLNLMLVDMKGGGFSDRLGNLPHCVGVVTDTAGEDEGTPAAYMLKRFLESLNAEIKRRKLLLSSLGVDNVDAYIRATRIINKIRKATPGEDVSALKMKLNDKQKEKLEETAEDLKPLSHLVLVVDEFTELKRFSSESDDVDFIAEITTIARVGRTLGFHIILVSQNIEGAITDDIRVNSKARICLKVATKQASKEMLGNTAAAAPTMPLNGRAYLLVGTGIRFEYFQSAYTGANKNMNIEPPVKVTRVRNSGKADKTFYSSDKDNEIRKAQNKNVNEHDTQLAYIVNKIIEISKNQPKPCQVFLPPLSGRINDQTEWEGI